MDAADTGFDHLCGTHRPGCYELRRGVGKEEGGPRNEPGLPLNVMFLLYANAKHMFEDIVNDTDNKKTAKGLEITKQVIIFAENK